MVGVFGGEVEERKSEGWATSSHLGSNVTLWHLVRVFAGLRFRLWILVCHFPCELSPRFRRLSRVSPCVHGTRRSLCLSGFS